MLADLCAGALEAEIFTTEASFDAIGRPVTQTTPDASVLHLAYGEHPPDRRADR